MEYKVRKGSNPCSKICGAIIAVFLGFIVFPLSMVLLAKNEQNYVCESNAIRYADDNAVDIGCSVPASTTFAYFACPVAASSLRNFTGCSFQSQCDEADFGSLVSFSSTAGSQKTEMAQCVERKETRKEKNALGQNVEYDVYTYSVAWESTHVASSGFRDQSTARTSCHGYTGSNPGFPTGLSAGTTTHYVSGSVEVGNGIQMNPGLVRDIEPFAEVPVSCSNCTGQGLQNPSQRPLTLSASNLMADGNTLLTCAPGDERVGCVRISYLRAMEAGDSPGVLAQVTASGDVKSEKVPGAWLCASSNKEWIRREPESGPYTKEEFIERLSTDNYTSVWIWRVVGVCLAWFAVILCMSPITTAADLVGDVVNWCPCGGYVEDILEGAVSAIVCFVACGIGCSTASFVIAIAWLVMRPLWGILLLALSLSCCACAFAAVNHFKGKKETKRMEETKAEADVEQPADFEQVANQDNLSPSAQDPRQLTME